MGLFRVLMLPPLVSGICFLLSVPGGAQAQHLTVQSVSQGQLIEVGADLAKPPGVGPFPAVILLPHCNPQFDIGLPVWAGLLHQWGYATIYAHTLSARGFFETCTKDSREHLVIGGDIRTDVYRLAEAAAADPGIRADKIAVLGRSFGGLTVVNFVVTDTPETASLRNEIAARGAKIVGGIAVSASCWTRDRIVLPILILTGALDDWTEPQRCVELARLYPDSVQLKVYPDAYHIFETPEPPNSFLGHRHEYNAPDAQDAYAIAHAFLDRIFR